MRNLGPTVYELGQSNRSESIILTAENNALIARTSGHPDEAVAVRITPEGRTELAYFIRARTATSGEMPVIMASSTVDFPEESNMTSSANELREFISEAIGSAQQMYHDLMRG